MALIKCPQCGRDISDRADSCIHCGLDLKNTDPNEKKKHKGIKVLIVTIIVLVLASAGISVPIIINNIKKNEAEKIKIEEEQKRIQKVIDEIDSIGEVTVNSKSELDIINHDYMELSEEERIKVTNYEKLKTSNDKLTMLEIAKSNEENNRYENKNDDLLTTLEKIEKKVKNADVITERYLKEMNTYGSDLINFINTRGRVLDSVYEYMDDAYKLCGNEKKFGELKTKLSKAKSDIPKNVNISSNDQVQKHLDVLEDLSYDLYVVELEVIDLYDELK